MNDTPQATATRSPHSPNPLSHYAYSVRDFDGRNGKKGHWTKIGSAWANADGRGFNIQLDCVPLDGRISLRLASDQRE